MNALLLLATAAPAANGEDHFISGIAITVAFIVIFVGSVWLLTAMILGARLGYFVTGACLFAVMVMLSAIWFVTDLGPKGEQGFWGDLGVETAWHAVGAGQLDSVSAKWGTWDVSDYPNGDGWVAPAEDLYLADLEGEDSTQAELENVKPIMDSLVAQALNAIPGIRESVADRVQGSIDLESGQFATTDIKMRQAEIDGHDSIVAVGLVVPTAELNAGDLDGAAEGTVDRYLVEVGDTVAEGDDLAVVDTDQGSVTVKAETAGRILSLAFAEGDAIKAGGNVATADISGTDGAPDPIEAAAVRVRGSVKVPSFIYLAVSFVLMILHLIGVSKTEKAAKLAQPQIA